MGFAGVLGCATTVGSMGNSGGTRFWPSESKPKSESRAKRISDFEAKKGVGGVLGGLWGEFFAVEGTVVVVVDEPREF